MDHRSKDEIVAAAQQLAATKGKTLKGLLTNPDADAKAFLQGVRRPGAMHAIEQAADNS